MSSCASISEGGEGAWVRDYLEPRYPELVESYVEALHLRDSAKRNGAIDADALGKLLAYAKSSRTPLSENVASMLGELYEIDEGVETAIRALATGRNVHERINALVALDSNRLTDLHSEIFAAALSDRSARVRALAADKIVTRGMRQLLDALNSAHLRETRPELKAELEADIQFLTQGYRIQNKGDTVWVTCRIPGRGSVGTSFPAAEFESKGRAWIAAQLTGTS
jgi:hypothetical protein